LLLDLRGQDAIKQFGELLHRNVPVAIVLAVDPMHNNQVALGIDDQELPMITARGKDRARKTVLKMPPVDTGPAGAPRLPAVTGAAT
jgi:hypothetical protein